MTSYRLEISASAEKQLRGLPPADQVRVLRAARQLGVEPYPQGCRKLVGYQDVFRVRVGRYRVIYSVDNKRIVVIVLKIGHRKDIYR